MKKENDNSRTRRYESRRENEEEERRGIKRPVRATRNPTYHEDNDSSEDEDKKTSLKKKKLSARAKSVESKASSIKEPTEPTFVKIASDEVVGVVKDLFISVFDSSIKKTDEVSFVKEFKRKSQSIVAVFVSLFVFDSSGFLPLVFPNNNLLHSSSFFSAIIRNCLLVFVIVGLKV